MVSEQTLVRVQAELLPILRGAIGERDARRDLITVDGETGPGWLFYERTVMTDAVNARRHEQGLAAVTTRDIADADGCAAGHADYVTKFTLYCAELVMAAPTPADPPAYQPQQAPRA
ncbi:MAG: hypothetical protein ACRDT6_18665 [Micromonosporaceae bacterium]